jgi:CBS domain-containing protein
MKIKDIMTKKVVLVNKNDDLRYIIDLMEKHEFTKLPVVDDGKLVGIVTDNKIADKLGSIKSKGIPAARMHASSVMDKEFHSIGVEDDVETILKTVGQPGLTMLPVCDRHRLVGVVTKADLLPLVTGNQNIREILREEIHAVSPEDRVVHARRILLDNDIARIPVVEEGTVVGIIADREIAISLANIKKSFSKGHQHHRLRELLVRDVMQIPAVTASVDVTVKEAAEKMIEHGVGCLPILDGEQKLIGIVTRTDLVKML